MCIRDRYMGEEKKKQDCCNSLQCMKKQSANTPRGILKKETPLSKKNSLHWDEVGIEQQEYDKERGKCQKITEAKTPYHRGLSSDYNEDDVNGDKILPENESKVEELDLELVSKKLEMRNDDKRNDMSDGYSSDNSNKGKHNPEFVKKRKNHYDEGKAFKAIKNKMIDDDE
eukprot:TRINITY_DN6007_c0_g1_i1.p1 TRINITY_DN6007_c0_g1~~TRINITY_DN6007_c0_g1_i1.p1  ORF type:complete len:171 (+),score=38.14 TRINITY_DN6007_c0_g1_i1:64-576(+)